MPKRIQRKRTMGWRAPANAVYVGRPTDFGNRYIIGHRIDHVDGKIVLVRDRAHATQLYEEWFVWQEKFGYPPSLVPLRGKDLLCWCRLDQPCHADILLKLANEGK